MKNQSKLSKKDDEDTGPVELLERPKEYIVRFRFPEVSSLQPPILGLYNVSFGYGGQGQLFRAVDFGERNSILRFDLHWRWQVLIWTAGWR